MHPILVGLVALSYLGFIGPKLVSAANDVTVVSGLVGLILVAFYVYKAVAFQVSANNSNSQKENNSGVEDEAK